jgi:predicted enzyme related to lactoylglutathione lyase
MEMSYSLIQKENVMSKRNIVHIEIPAVDVKGTGKFYADLFGWKLQHDEKMNYTMWEAGDGDAYGGFPQVSAENPAGQVLIYIDSEDIDADLKKVEKLGMGWYGVFQDPTGNVLGLYTSMNPANK